MLSVALLSVALFAFGALFASRERRWIVLWVLISGAAGGGFFWLTEAFEIRKVAGTLAMPAGMVWLLLLVIAAVALRRTPGWFAALLWIAWLAFGAAGNVWLGNALLDRLQSPFVAADPAELGPFDAVLVLAGGVSATPGGELVVGDSADRALVAAHLAREGHIRRLITTGPPIAVTGDTVTVPEVTAELWRRLGIADDRILQAPGPRSTSEEIDRLAELQAEHGWKRLGVLSSAYHLRRAVALCKGHGLEVEPLAADISTPDPRWRPFHLIPQAGGFESVHTACWELLGAAMGM